MSNYAWKCLVEVVVTVCACVLFTQCSVSYYDYKARSDQAYYQSSCSKPKAE